MKYLPSVRPFIHELPIILVFSILTRIWSIFTDGYDVSWFCNLCYIGVWCIYAYIIAFSIYYTKKNFVRWLWYIVLFTIYLFSAFIYYNFEMELGPTPLSLVIETDSRETEEFFQTFLFSDASIKAYTKVTLLILFTILIEFTYRHYIIKRINLSKRHYAASIMLLVLFGLGIYNCRYYLVYFNLSNGDTLDDIALPAPDIYSRMMIAPSAIIASSNAMRKAIQMSIDDEVVTTDIAKSDSINIILVIGESYNKHHAQLYGYSLPTTPIMLSLQEKGNLYVFNDVVTPFNRTSPTMKNMMSCNSIGESERWYDYPYFPSKFREAGYNVYYWDNQRYMYRGALYEFTLNSYLYNDSLAEKTYSKTNSKAFEFDGQLVEDFKQQTDIDSSAYNFIMFHLLGQHFTACSRYPHNKQFELFTSNDINRSEPYFDIEKLQYIAEYDNATLYNDYVIGEIVSYFSKKNAILIYLSDHGEEVFDYRDYKGRSPSEPLTRKLLSYQYDIPFIIWCSDKFKLKYPETVLAIQNAIGKPFMIDNLCQLMFHIGALHTKYYHQERDILSSKYIPKTRFVNERRIDYSSVK